MMLGRASLIAHLGCGLAVLCGCSSPYVRSFVQHSADVKATHLDPASAYRILKASARQYDIVTGRLRTDSLTEAYRDEMPVGSWELEAGAADVWDEASMELFLGNYARAADLLTALVETVPQCADCRVELARALLGMANHKGRSERSTEGLRRTAADHLAIASALRPELPVGRGLYIPPERLGRTNIQLQPKGGAALSLYHVGNDAYNAGDVAGARRAYFQMLREEPDFARGYVAMGDTYMEEAQWSDGGIWYAQALRIDSTDYLAWKSLAQCYDAMGRVSAAYDAALWAVIYNYQDVEAWETLARVAAAREQSLSRCRLDKRVEIREMSGDVVQIVVDSTLRGPSQTAWLGYVFIRAVWRYEGRLAVRHPDVRRYRPTFDEEMEATAALAAVWSTAVKATERTDAPFDEQLERLWRIAEAGYLPEYVIYEEMAADNPDLVGHLPASELARIRQYVERFVITGLVL